eukprot:scaffold10512_cov128-Isochrysis_galbana.AAC.2
MVSATWACRTWATNAQYAWTAEAVNCDSRGGCCDSRRSLCCTHFPCQERAALASGPGQGQQCEIVRWARPGGAPSSCAGAQSHLRRALVGAVRMGPLGARIQFCVGPRRLRDELTGRHV